MSEVFAWRSPSFKAMGLDPNSLSDDDLIGLMLKEPRLIRRPITRIGTELIVGGDTKGLESALAR